MLQILFLSEKGERQMRRIDRRWNQIFRSGRCPRGASSRYDRLRAKLNEKYGRIVPASECDHLTGPDRTTVSDAYATREADVPTVEEQHGDAAVPFASTGLPDAVVAEMAEWHDQHHPELSDEEMQHLSAREEARKHRGWKVWRLTCDGFAPTYEAARTSNAAYRKAVRGGWAKGGRTISAAAVPIDLPGIHEQDVRVVPVTETGLVQVIQSRKGAVIVTLETRTEPKMRKTGNPYVGVVKHAVVNGLINAWVCRSCESWGERTPAGPWLVHHGRTYLTLKVQHVGEVRYETKDGKPIDADALAPFLYAPSDDPRMILRTYAIGSIVALRLNRTRYEVVRDNASPLGDFDVEHLSRGQWCYLGTWPARSAAEAVAKARTSHPGIRCRPASLLSRQAHAMIERQIA